MNHMDLPELTLLRDLGDGSTAAQVMMDCMCESGPSKAASEGRASGDPLEE